MTLKEARHVASMKINNARRLHNILATDRLEKVYNQVIEEENENAITEFGKLVKQSRTDALKNWVKRHESKDITEMSVAELRSLAAGYGIQLYYRKTKIELLQSIRYAIERPPLCKRCSKRHPEVACTDKNSEFDF